MEIEERIKEERGITNLRALATVNCVRNGLSISLSFSLVSDRHTHTETETVTALAGGHVSALWHNELSSESGVLFSVSWY